jgi:hypothetical protein
MSEKRIALLICPKCQTVEPIEWCGEGRNEDGTIQPCGHRQCEDSIRARVVGHTVKQATGHYLHATLGQFDVSEKDWTRLSTRKEILKQLAPPGSATPYGADMYDLKANFHQDAMTCWKQHNRTKNCQDWKSSSKRLVAPTRELRKELGLETRDKHRPAATFLCDFCPVRSVMMQRANSDKYGYDFTE